MPTTLGAKQEMFTECQTSLANVFYVYMELKCLFTLVE